MTATFTVTEWGIRYEVAGDSQLVDPCSDEEDARENFANWPRETPATPICIVRREVTYGRWEDTQ